MSNQPATQHSSGPQMQRPVPEQTPGVPGAQPPYGPSGPWQHGPVPPAGYGIPPRPTRTGDGAWWAGLVVFALIPFVSSLAAGITQWLVGRGQQKHGPLAAENGRRAANWGMTYLLATLVLVGGHFFLLYLLTRDGSSIGGFYPFGIIITVWMAYTVVHVVVSIWGGIVAKSGRVFKLNGLPFLGPAHGPQFDGQVPHHRTDG